MHYLKGMRRHRSAQTVLIVAAFASACAATAQTTPELQALLNGNAPPRDVPASSWPEVRAFYALRGHTLAWARVDGPTEAALAAVDTLRSAVEHGLDPAHYEEPALRNALAGLETREGSAEQPQAVAEFDIRLTSALLRLGRHVATGRLAPKSIDARWNAQRQPPDYVAALHAASDGAMTSFLDTIQPKHGQYIALRQALASLRVQAASGWPKVPRARMQIGQWNAGVVVPLRQRLLAAGLLVGTASPDSPQYDADVEAAVKAFQHQHRLAPTGVLDRATVDELNVPLESRVAQIEANLERWRWLPDDLGTRHFVVNVPFFTLLAREQGRTALEMRVVVGKRGNETPLFSDHMETVVFSPYWNVPETIAFEETLPAVQSDPGFLARNNMEIVNAAGEVVPPEEILWDEEAALDELRFRQRPGASNALGHVKFLFPNEHAVYLHDTPADNLFARIGRAFSHGCVRVEEPEQLAKYVLRDQAEWTDAAIRDAMRAGTERHVKLTTAIPVHIIYMTAWVDERGTIMFADDVYGYDIRQTRR